MVCRDESPLGSCIVRLAVLIALLAACGDNLRVDYGDTPSIEVVSMPAIANRDLDVLLLIDDSPAQDFQSQFAKDLPGLLTELDGVSGPLNLHVGVATTDLGATGSDDPTHPGPPIGQLNSGGCSGAGKDGVLQRSGASVNDLYLIDEDDGAGARRTNYLGNRQDVLARMMLVGNGGCGFEQPFAAIRRALTNPLNAGFLRPAAQLVVINLEDEDDCSFRDARLISATEPIGPQQSFRCTAQGVTCNEPLDVVGPKTGCHAREDSMYVEPIEKTVESLRSIKPDRSMLTVAEIAGDPEPFKIELRTPPGGGTAILALAQACSFLTVPGLATAADPGVRLRDLTRALESRGVFTTVCTASLAPSLHTIASALKQALGVACLDTTKLRDGDTAPGIQPTCDATEVRDGVESPLPFELLSDAAACPDGDHLRFVPHFTSSPTLTTFVRATCQVP